MSKRKNPQSEIASTPIYPVLDRELPFVADLELMDTTLFGLRRAQSMSCILSVVAAPFAKLNRLKTLLSGASHVAYVICGSVVYVGHGNGDRKFGDRLTAEELRQAQIYVLYSVDTRFDKPSAGYVEARLIDRLFAIGVALANLNRPFGSELNIDNRLEPLVRHAEVLLGAAGFRPLEEVRNVPRRATRTLGALRLVDGIEPIEPKEMPIQPASNKLYQLNHRGMRASGFFIGKTFHVEPGADYALEVKRGMSRHNKVRRKQVEQYLERSAGDEHRKRLRVGLRCRSAPIAAKVLSGMHIGGKAWRPF
jgi:hypothetical protein